MNDKIHFIPIIAAASVLAACSVDDIPTSESLLGLEPKSMEGATCAVMPVDIEFGDYKHRYQTRDCLRQLAYKDWAQARAEAAHIASWNIAGPDLGALTNTLTRYESAEAVGIAMRKYGLLDGDGDPDMTEYYDDDWQPLTGSDWLLEAGNQYWFDAETGMHPNYHDSLLHELANLFGDDLAGATFAEDAPEWDSEEPYELQATLGDREWNRQAQNYGDWYDVDAVLDLINEMAADAGSQHRAMPLATYDQTVRVVVGPGKSLIAAASDGLLVSAHASDGMESGKAFEEEVRRLYRINAE